MIYASLTVGQLRAAIADIPDDVPVYVNQGDDSFVLDIRFETSLNGVPTLWIDEVDRFPDPEDRGIGDYQEVVERVEEALRRGKEIGSARNP